MAEESLVVNWDGSVILSHLTSFERKNRKTGEVKEPTLKGGGFRPRTKDNAGKDGHGFNMVAAVTQTGLPLVARFGPINDPEGALVDFASRLRRPLAPLAGGDAKLLARLLRPVSGPPADAVDSYLAATSGLVV
jgi:hypothetical protein